MNLNKFNIMVYEFFIGASIALLFLVLVIYFFDYPKAFYLYAIFAIIVLVLVLSFGTKIANYLYGIDEIKSFTIEEQYENDRIIYPFQKAIGGLIFFSVISLFIMSSVNLFVLKNFKEIPIFVSIVIFIFTLIMTLSILMVMRVYSNRII